MGIYDQIHGECPHCGFFNGRKKGVRKGPGGFQTKSLLTNRRMTYDYYVGDVIPNVFKMYLGQIQTICYEQCGSCKKGILISCGVKPETLEVIILPFEKAFVPVVIEQVVNVSHDIYLT